MLILTTVLTKLTCASHIDAQITLRQWSNLQEDEKEFVNV